MSNSGGAQNVCFYSNKCKWSEAFIKAVSATPYKAEFVYICVDTKPDGTRAKLPTWLKKVPTLVIKGEEEPRTDSDVMNWLSEKKLMSQGAGSSGPGAQEPEPWVGGEMGGSLTKGFSFLGSNDSNDAPMGNFEFLGGQNAIGTKTASDIPGGGLGARAQPKNKKVELFDKQMEEYMMARTNGMPMPPPRQ
jgi:hypothetical protein